MIKYTIGGAHSILTLSFNKTYRVIGTSNYFSVKILCLHENASKNFVGYRRELLFHTFR